MDWTRGLRHVGFNSLMVSALCREASGLRSIHTSDKIIGLHHEDWQPAVVLKVIVIQS